MAQKRPGCPRHPALAAQGPYGALPGRRTRRLARRRRDHRGPAVPADLAPAAAPRPEGRKEKPVADRYRIGTRPIDTDSIALIVKNWTGLAGFDAAGFAGHSLRRGAISSGVAQGVHIARLKQFSGHASLKSLEEYVELDELRHNHPLKEISNLSARRPNGAGKL